MHFQTSFAILFFVIANTIRYVSLQELSFSSSLPINQFELSDEDDVVRDWTPWIPFEPSSRDLSPSNRFGRRFFRRFLRPRVPPIARRLRNLPIFQPPTILNTLAYRLLKFTNDARMSHGLSALCLNL